MVHLPRIRCSRGIKITMCIFQGDGCACLVSEPALHFDCNCSTVHPLAALFRALDAEWDRIADKSVAAEGSRGRFGTMLSFL